jgi:flavodoxin
MKVIIVVGSKHGSTRSIAESVGDELRDRCLGVSIAAASAADISFDGSSIASISKIPGSRFAS